VGTKWFKNESLIEKCNRLKLTPEQQADILARPEAERDELLGLMWAQESERRHDRKFSVAGPVSPGWSPIDVVTAMAPKAAPPERRPLSEPKWWPSPAALAEARAMAALKTAEFLQAGPATQVFEPDLDDDDFDEPRRGRPCIGEQPMSGTERSRRSRALLKRQLELEEAHERLHQQERELLREKLRVITAPSPVRTTASARPQSPGKTSNDRTDKARGCHVIPKGMGGGTRAKSK
jgi:hypothetical protein